MQQQQNVRPVSTYDNLSATASSNNTTKPKLKQQQQQQQQQLWTGESSGLSPEEINNVNESSTLQCDADMNGTTIIPQIPKDAAASTAAAAAAAATTTTQDLNETSHSIAAVRAALSDAKSKFFGININERILCTPTAMAAMDSIGPDTNYPSAPQSARTIMPQMTKSSDLVQPMKTPIVQSQRFGATYEQIPLADLDAPSPSQAVYMSTTVPQNIKGMKIAGRHTPTRNSLRHSRMIVVNHTNHDTPNIANGNWPADCWSRYLDTYSGTECLNTDKSVPKWLIPSACQYCRSNTAGTGSASRIASNT
ncbi:uncharacterized protein LOC6564783 isoform X2 [Drosophila grimshawi]|uniref:uncharacterized protein LOC6564783 isoform X2 n=1 Tax=Drosophila grimshawi TaxID=7222 RepID=UPI000C86EFC1|nr:uncharacterized protein LOC6564783 isoform X2 [Drosophila grimshawi]